jgi:hypothetical protein
MRIFNIGGRTHVQPRETMRCNRCGLEYLLEDTTCTHCKGMSNGEIIEKLHIPHSEQQESNQKIGLWFLVIFMVIVALIAFAF